MMLTALYITIAMVTLAALLNVYRLIKGPDAPDRILALDTLYINAMGFVGTVAMAKYLKRGSVIE